MLVNYYEILEISPSAGPQEIRAAITKQRRIWVRRQSSPDPDRRMDAEQRVRQIDQAEKTLLDAAARRAFDGELARRRSPLPPPRTPTSADRRGSAAGADDRKPFGGTETEGGGQPGGRRSAREWLSRAQAYLDQGSTGPAAQAAREATVLMPDDPMAWFTYGQAHAADGRPAEAELGFAEAIRIEPDNPEFHRGLGDAYLDQKKWGRAVPEFDVVLRAMPDDPRALAGLGEAYVHTGHARQGIAMLQQAARARPDDPAVKVALASGLYDVALDKLTQIDGGTRVAMSGRQVAVLARTARKLRRLGRSDPQIGGLEAELRSLVKDARKPYWQPSRNKRYYLAVLAVAILFMTIVPEGMNTTVYQGFGVVLAVAVTVTYVVRHRIPAWKIRREDWAHRVTRKGV